jgi:AraC-like DNA-binding protein
MRPVSIYSTNSLHIIEEESQFTLDRIKILIKEGSINFKADAVIPAIISPDYKNEYFSDYTTFSSHVVYAIMDIICDVLDNKYSYIVFKNSSSQFVMLLSFTKNERLQPDKIRKLLIFIKDKILRLLNITITIAYSNSIMYLETAMDILVCLKSFRENKLYLSPGGLYKLGEISKLIADNYYLASFIKEQIKTLIELKDFSTLKDKIHNIFANMQNNQIRRDKVIEITEQIKDSIDYCILQYNSNKTTGRINFYDFEFILQYEMAITHYIDELSKDIIGLSNQLYSTSISRALSYIENNYKKAISLEGCAVDAGVSYTHLSRIFKKETSLSFSEYLNRFRLSKAKIFLAEKRIPIKQIVEEVGFSNYNYFFKVFKEIEGITPIEFVDEANN